MTYEDCACFLANAVGSSWEHIVVAHYGSATICPELLGVFQKGSQFSYRFNRTNVEVLASALVEVTEADAE